jgi:hypothetical protein
MFDCDLTGCMQISAARMVPHFSHPQLPAKSRELRFNDLRAHLAPAANKRFRPAELYSVATIARYPIARNRLVAESAI